MWARVRVLQPLLAHLRPQLARAAPSSLATRTLAPLPHLSAPALTRRFASRSIVVPSLGDSISEGTLAEVLLPAGSSVRVDDVVARLETDKVSVDIRSDAAGRIEAWSAKVGDNVKVGAALLTVEVGAEGSAPAAQQQQTEGNVHQAGPATFASGSKPDLETGLAKEPRQPAAQSGTQQPHSMHPMDAHTQHRVPLIAFRYGKREQQPTKQAHAAQQQGAASTGTSADFVAANEAAFAAWDALPARYKKKGLKEAQLAMIELGGALDYEPKKKARAQ